jgi:hypothetical protein
LKQIIRKAREEGDVDTETEAHERLTSLMFEQRSMTEEARAKQQAYDWQHAQQAQQANQQSGFETIDHECLLWLLKSQRSIYTLNNKASNTYFNPSHSKVISKFGFSRISLAG